MQCTRPLQSHLRRCMPCLSEPAAQSPLAVRTLVCKRTLRLSCQMPVSVRRLVPAICQIALSRSLIVALDRSLCDSLVQWVGASAGANPHWRQHGPYPKLRTLPISRDGAQQIQEIFTDMTLQALFSPLHSAGMQSASNKLQSRCCANDLATPVAGAGHAGPRSLRRRVPAHRRRLGHQQVQRRVCGGA